MNYKVLFSTLIVASSIFMFSCSDEKEETGAGTLEIEFDNIAIVDGVQKQLSTVTAGSEEYGFKNNKNQDFNINLLRYYISNIKLEGKNGASYTKEVSVSASKADGVYLIDESKSASTLVSLSDIPAGEYNKLTFTVGVEENGITEGAAGGVLDPATCKMFWNWNAGYVAVKFEGQSAVSAGGATGESVKDVAKGIAYHVGGWRNVDGTPFVNNNKTITLDFDTNAKVAKGKQPHVHLTFDILTLLKDVDFTGNNNVHKPVDAKDIANNIPSAFAYDHIHQ